jgi:DNA-binding IscR family transcriptional regulator
MSANCRFAMAVHVLAVLAYKEGDRVSSEFLASSVNTNPVIIRRLLLALQRARLVETRRGPGFGSRLSCSPGRINLAQVYDAVECQTPFVLPRKKANSACPVGRIIEAAMKEVCVSARAALERELGRITLAAVVQAVRGQPKLKARVPEVFFRGGPEC